MKIFEIIKDLKAQLYFGKTFKGRSINDASRSNISAALSDTKNHDAEAVKCVNCGIMLSGLLIQSGCPNCGSSELIANIDKKDTIGG